MVLEANIPFHIVNKHVIAFLTEMNVEDLNESVKTAIVAAWKDKSNINRLKSSMRKSTKKPKRVVSKYLYYCQDERPKIIAENPGMNIKDVTCELGRRWAAWQLNPDPERDAMIQKLFEEDKKRYDEAKATMPRQVKRPAPKSPYLAFCAAEREIAPKISMKELSIKWNIVKQDPIELERYQSIVAEIKA